MTREDWILQFEAAGDPAKKVWMEQYMRGQFPFLGIQTALRRSLCKDLFRQLKTAAAVDWDFVQFCWDKPYREYQYVACDYLRMMQKKLMAADLQRIGDLVVTKSWWDSVDGLHPVAGALVLQYPKLAPEMLRWSQAENIWLRRVAIDHQLGRRKKTDLALLEQILLNNLGQRAFFINKAIGWSLRDYGKTDPAWVAAFVERNRPQLAALSIREALKNSSPSG